MTPGCYLDPTKLPPSSFPLGPPGAQLGKDQVSGELSLRGQVQQPGDTTFKAFFSSLTLNRKEGKKQSKRSQGLWQSSGVQCFPRCVPGFHPHKEEEKGRIKKRRKRRRKRRKGKRKGKGKRGERKIEDDGENEKERKGSQGVALHVAAIPATQGAGAGGSL